MKILITYSSRHGATEEIASAITKTISQSFPDTEISDVSEVKDISDYDAVVLGSAVYAGSWRKPAMQFAQKNMVELKRLPLWTFSSGPLGEAKESRNEPIGPNVIKLMEELQPIEHKVFPGKLDKAALNFAEKGIVKVVKAPYGDYRDFKEIEKWAKSITKRLKS
jgi:menaquinone-dependent protoporphyrinogen oxidase